MTPEQQKHCDDLIGRFGKIMQYKYAKGVKEHGGNLWDKDVIDLIQEAVLESVDQFTYLQTAYSSLMDAMVARDKVKTNEINHDSTVLGRTQRISCSASPHGDHSPLDLEYPIIPRYHARAPFLKICKYCRVAYAPETE